MYDLIDNEYPSGWGIDVWFYNHCILSGRIKDGKMGVVDVMKIVHNPRGLKSTNSADKNPGAISAAQQANWLMDRQIKFVPYHSETIGYLYE